MASPRHNAARSAVAAIGWVAVALGGAVLVLVVATVAAGLAVGLWTVRSAGRLGGGPTALRGRPEHWPAMARVDMP